VVDLGAAPGGWCQVASKRVKAEEGRGKIIAIDMHGIDPIPAVTIFKKNFLDDDAPQLLMDALGGRKADVVLSDMAAHATGHRQTDHILVMTLAEAGLEFARQVLAPGGIYLAKVLRGVTEGEMLKQMKKDFASVRHVKPMASRDDSAELFVLAMGFRG
jgi:23S rRNA (uridine2552-2'-O)-methyltransferase